MPNFDTSLHRPIQSGLMYNRFFDVAANTVKPSESGDTYTSIKLMKGLIQSHYVQASRIGPVLNQSTLKGTTTAVYNFLYHHIQYKQDGRLQQLRTPNNSWANRKTGIDCKSYSIFASCILTTLNIKHYIRQIKQPFLEPNKFTHVYIVVPINQVTANLESGYYVIDATVKRNIEPIFNHKHDTLMDLPHVALNGATKKPTRKRKPVATKKTTSPLAKTALNACGRLKTGFKYLKGGKIVAVAKKAKTTRAKPKAKTTVKKIGGAKKIGGVKRIAKKKPTKKTKK